MVSEKVKNFLVLYFSLLLPVILFFITALVSANLIAFLLLLGWIGAGILIVFLPTHPESENQ